MTDKNSEQKEAKIPSWVYQATKICSGCHDNFYNLRANYGCNWCYNLKRSYGKRKTKPECYH